MPSASNLSQVSCLGALLKPGIPIQSLPVLALDDWLEAPGQVLALLQHDIPRLFVLLGHALASDNATTAAHLG